MEKSVDLKWLQTGGGSRAGVTWGVPWKKGTQSADTEFKATDGSGKEYAVQTWPLAYWPDGSMKWSAHAAVLDTGKNGYKLCEGHAEAHRQIRVTRLDGGAVEIDTGKMVCRLPQGSEKIIDSIKCEGRTVCTGAGLDAVLETRARTRYGCKTETIECPGRVTSLQVLQDGPVRCCVVIKGNHSIPGETRKWLPFTLHLYFYAGDNQIRILHTFLYDGNPNADFLKGIGMKFEVPLEGAAYNRRIAFRGDSGFFYEPVQLLQSWRPKISREIYQAQLSGKNVDLNQEDLAVAKDIPTWNNYKLVQDSANHYQISKNTQKECCYVHALDGEHAGGLAYVGGENGGLAAGISDFWQKFPRSLELTGMTEKAATLRAWLYSPDCAAMDLRHYDTRAYVQTYYEGAEELRSTPFGIANTNELRLWGFCGAPGKDILEDCAQMVQSAPLPMCLPEYYHGTGVFGIWSLPDRSSKKKAAIEDRLDYFTSFYQNEISQRNWYGFWNYGDVMHTYDTDRHCWKYDMGGYAWDNTELMSDLALWYQFLRTGRADIFTMASAMTRHVSETDVYHTGPYKGLGSRHNVLHWGCGCKEARIAMAAHNRFYYYLTADERIGEIMDETTDADFSTLTLDPMRVYFPKDSFPTHARTGPDWASFCSNWMTAWERHRNEKYHEKIQAGIDSLKKMPFRLISGPTFGYDPNTGKLSFLTESPGEHLMICQGEPEVWMELADLLNDPQWNEMLAEYGRFYMFSPSEKVEKTGLPVKGKGWSFPLFAASMAAYAAVYYHDEKLAEKIWDIVHQDVANKFRTVRVPDGDYVNSVAEIPNLSTNEAAQWCINVIQCLELIGNQLSHEG